MKKILIVTPKFPFPATGACEQDRSEGIKDFIRYGFEVRVIVKIANSGKIREVEKIADELGIKIFPVLYKFNQKTKSQKFKEFFRRFLWPVYLDGAAFEYSEAEIQSVFGRQIEEWRPDVAWFDYTYLWPLYKIAERKNTPIITRSVNFEPVHFLDEDGHGIINLIKSAPKFFSEFVVASKSNLIFSISPKEERIYKKLGAKKVINLSLRGLPIYLKEEREIKPKEVLHLFFMGSTYNVFHNRKSLEFIIKDIFPELQRKVPNKFIFHILGGKIPPAFEKYFNSSIIYEGYVGNLEQFLMNMDAAVVPSLCGAGMQQKIFEPLVRGIPTVTSPRGMVGYPFKHGEHLFLAENKEEYVNNIIKLRDYNLRKKLSANALRLSKRLFSREIIDSTVLDNLRNLDKK